MAQAGIALAKNPLASPQPTTPPHPRDLARQLSQRQLTSGPCGWVEGDIASPEYCPAGAYCVYNTLEGAAYCCNAVNYPTFCPHATACLDSTDVANFCSGTCLSDISTAKCTSGGSNYCVTKVFNYFTVPDLVTEWDCGPVPGSTISVYDRLSVGVVTTSGGVAVTDTGASASTGIIASNYDIPSAGTSKSTPTGPGPTTTSTIPLGPVTTTPNAVSSSSKSGLGAGAIAGIVVGAIVLIVLIVGMILLYRYKTARNPRPTPPVQITHDPSPHLTGMATVQQESPPLSSRPSNFTMPSNTPLVSHANNELGPDDSASNIGGPYSMVSQAPPPDVSSEVHSYPSQSALGSLPQFSTQHGVQPVASPGTEFGSMPPVHAPDVNPGYTFVPKGPQQ